MDEDKTREQLIEELKELRRQISECKGAIELQAAHDELERRVKSTEAQLRQAQKMEAVGQLAGGVPHDFNNMITVLQGNTDLALTKIGEDEPVYRNLKEIRRITGKAAALTRQLLTFSRHQPMEKDILNINGCVEDMFKMLKRLIGENISLEIELSPDLWNIDADPGQLEQLVMNLVVNARDAMQGGGRLIIKTANVKIDKAYCDMYKDGECREGRFVRISVEDTGTGMDDYIRSHIFEPFFTTKGVEKGTGLRLAVVYGIVKGHNGWIDVYSEVGKGTVFKIYLPSVFADIEQKRGEDVSEEIRGGQEGVLVVEDEEDLRELAKMMLEMHGYKVFVASSYEEAVSVYKENGVNIDVLFTDMMLTGRSGIELSEELKRIRPELRVLFSSGYSDEHFQLPANEKNEYSFLEKPYTLADLLKAVREILDRR